MLMNDVYNRLNHVVQIRTKIRNRSLLDTLNTTSKLSVDCVLDVRCMSRKRTVECNSRNYM